MRGERPKLLKDDKIRRVILCSGKVYYDLFEERERRGIDDVYIVRVEQLYPFPLKALVAVGALLLVFYKGAKFSMFKPAEEMVYIGLDEQSRTKGKAAIDVAGAQTGKSVGSVLQQVVLVASAGSMAARSESRSLRLTARHMRSPTPAVPSAASMARAA